MMVHVKYRRSGLGLDATFHNVGLERKQIRSAGATENVIMFSTPTT